MSRRSYNWAVIAAAVVAYFVVFPDDLGFLGRLLTPTQSLAPGAWALVIAIVVVAGAVRIWGRRPADGPTGSAG